MFPKPTNYFAGKQMSDPIPQWNEQDRLKAIDSYHILDTPREEEFDDIVKLAAEACNVPVSLISFVTSGRQWFKAAIGTELEETSLDSSICSHAILQKGVFVVPDTTKDPRTQNNPLVAGDPKVRFYAGALLETSEGLPLGTVCVLDFQPRQLTEKETKALKALARQVMIQLELRRTLSELRHALKGKDESEGRTRFLSQLTQKLSMLSRTDELNRVATREVGQFLGGDRCYFFESIEPEWNAHVLPDWTIEGNVTLEGEYDLAGFGPPEMWETLRTQSTALNDVSSNGWTKKFLTNYQAMHIGAALIAPFCRDGKWIACMGVSSKQPREWTKDEQTLLEDVMARVWPLIERARSELALRISEQRIRDANILLSDRAAHLDSVVEQRTQKLSETIAELEAFSYSISHDMRAPLRSMVGFAQMLQEEYGSKLDPTATDYLNRISNASRRMDQLIQDVLVFSRISRDEIELEVIAVESLLREIISTYPNFDPNLMTIQIKSPLLKIRGNQALLTQCFSNILENGFKFVAAGKKPHVEISSEAYNGVTRLCFKDNGIGIAAKHITRIFEIFNRVGRETDGTGIGLAIVSKAAEKMGGSVGVHSVPNEGSTFYLDLPSA